MLFGYRYETDAQQLHIRGYGYVNESLPNC